VRLGPVAAPQPDSGTLNGRRPLRPVPQDPSAGHQRV